MKLATHNTLEICSIANSAKGSQHGAPKPGQVKPLEVGIGGLACPGGFRRQAHPGSGVMNRIRLVEVRVSENSDRQVLRESRHRSAADDVFVHRCSGRG
jgi:hypothetical protein